MTNEDKVYWGARAAKQRELAKYATDEKVAACHNELAGRLDRMAESDGHSSTVEPALAHR